MPYPNIAMSSDTAQGTKGKVRRQSYLPRELELQNEYGRRGRERRRRCSIEQNQRKAEFVNFSFDVKVEGKGVARAFDLMLHNDKNTPPFPLLQGPVVPIPGPQRRICYICDKDF